MSGAQETSEALAGKLRQRINTQNPVTWSEALNPYKMQLAYLPTDVRPLDFYIDELIGYEDLFMLAFYTGPDPHILEKRHCAEILDNIIRDSLGQLDDLQRQQIINGQQRLDDLQRQQIINELKLQLQRKKPYQTGSSHVVLLHKNRIYDPAHSANANGLGITSANEYCDRKKQYYLGLRDDSRVTGLHTKRLFRVVPRGHKRGL
jgi:hypothetical protein